jgi:ElaB/YqjD/DUF883 family membrane-anchored ribosome-binding protein
MAQGSPQGAEPFERTADRATDRIQDLADQVEGSAGRVAEKGRDVGARMHEAGGDLRDAVDKSVREQPMATLALVAIAGFVLGALWKR